MLSASVKPRFAKPDELIKRLWFPDEMSHIVLAPNTPLSKIALLKDVAYPFNILSWEQFQYEEIVPDDPFYYGYHKYKSLSHHANLFEQYKLNNNTLVAVADLACSDTSRLALIACGDLQRRIYFGHTAMSEDTSALDFSNYRGNLLSKLIKPEFTYLLDKENNSGTTHFPNRVILKDLVKYTNQFPLYNGFDAFVACAELQRHWMDTAKYYSFLNLTTNYDQKGGYKNKFKRSNGQIESVILVTDNFNFEESILFWNLRANYIYVGWISFSEFEKYIDDIANWLDTQTTFSKFTDNEITALSTSNDKESEIKLETILVRLKEKSKKRNYEIKNKNELLFYDFVRPSILKEHVVITSNHSKCSFLLKTLNLAQSTLYKELNFISLEWSGLMTPQIKDIGYGYIEQGGKFFNHINILFQESKKEELENLSKHLYLDFLSNLKRQLLHKVRITKDRYIRVRVENDSPIKLTCPTTSQIFSALFIKAGFSRLEQSKTAKYHTNFINRAGGFEKASFYLKNDIYKKLFEILSNNNDDKNKDKNKLPGWVVSHPIKRRILNHWHISQALNQPLPTDTEKYFDRQISRQLPDQIRELVENKLLERGFFIKCNFCPYESWYPVEHVGQYFECYSCSESQICTTNLTSFYRLPEVIFQGFMDHMEVPILALNNLRRKSEKYFDWVPDSDIYWKNKDKEMNNNIDILCINDGKSYVGEAKSSDEIKSEQFSFYERLCQEVFLDGIVFATSQEKWSKGTINRIEKLKSTFKGEIVVLTYKDLYSQEFF